MAGRELTPLELARQQIIARNRERLIALGIPLAVENLKATIQATAAEKPKQQAKRAKRTTPDEELYVPEDVHVGDGGEPGVRKSARLRAQKHPQPKLDDAALREQELGTFIVEGRCPRCQRLYQSGHKQHLERCRGFGSPTKRHEDRAVSQLPDEEKLQARMKQLELGGLVDFTDESAVFIVIGSTGNHYKVTLSDGARKCQCVDHRCRKHDCKHIKLMLQQLHISDTPQRWHAAIEDSIKANMFTHPDDDDDNDDSDGDDGGEAGDTVVKEEATAVKEEQGASKSEAACKEEPEVGGQKENHAGNKRKGKRITNAAPRKMSVAEKFL